MNQVVTYIDELLHSHFCVVIPGFGAFVAERKPASFTKEGVLMPPYKEIVFNSDLVSNDGVLIHYIASRTGVSYHKAMIWVEEFVLFCKEKLTENQWVELGDIGYFKQDKGYISFVSYTKKNFLSDSFGLEGFVIQKISQPENKVVLKQNKMVWLEYTKYAAVFVLMILSLFSVGLTYTDYLDIEKNSVSASTATMLVSEASLLSDLPLKLPSVTLNVVKHSNEAVEDNRNEEITNQTERFYVIAGVFKNKENADNQLQSLINNGFKAHIVGKNRLGYYQVSYQGFVLRSEAEFFLKQIRSKHKCDGWILEKQ